MSTRSQIRFVEGDWVAQIYRHSDGYPANVIDDLKGFWAWYSSEPMARSFDPSYMAADFIYYDKLSIAKSFKGKGLEKLGHGVEPVAGIHGDEQYIYVVYWAGTVKVKVSENFPKDDEGAKKAFETATCEFDGTLDEAYERYVAKKIEAYLPRFL